MRNRNLNLIRTKMIGIIFYGAYICGQTLYANQHNDARIGQSHCLSEDRMKRLVDSVNGGDWLAASRISRHWYFCKNDTIMAKFWMNKSDSLGNYWPRHFRLLKELQETNPNCEKIRNDIRSMRWAVRDSGFVRDSIYLDNQMNLKCSAK